MEITWFGHSAFRIVLDGAVILIDPFIENPTFAGDRDAAAAGATHVLLTHGHDDHIGSAPEICAATGAVLVANPEVCTLLAQRGVERTEHINHGGEIDFGAFRVAYVPAWHSSSTTIGGVPVYLGNPAGW
jgi:L-ascorbate metabolism protein UlaG (beta-lactamase superfamily)